MAGRQGAGGPAKRHAAPEGRAAHCLPHLRAALPNTGTLLIHTSLLKENGELSPVGSRVSDSPIV